MSDNGFLPKPPGRRRGRAFERGHSGSPGGRRQGSRNKATLAAAALLEGESGALTRKAVELALAGDPTALRLCLERLLPPCRERPVTFRLPPLEAAPDGEAPGPSPHGVSVAMNAVISGLASGEIMPGEAERIARVVETFVAAIATIRREGPRLNMLQILTADDNGEDDPCDESDRGDGDENGDYGDADDCDP
jgi:hypothetical protein